MAFWGSVLFMSLTLSAAGAVIPQITTNISVGYLNEVSANAAASATATEFGSNANAASVKSVTAGRAKHQKVGGHKRYE